MQVGCEVNTGREDTLLVLTLRLAVELFPPLTEEVELRLIVDHDFNLLASLIESVTNSSILGGWVLLERNILATLLLHVLSTLHQLLDVETGTGNGEQTYWSQYRETATYIVGNDKALVALLVSASASSTTLCIRHGHNHLLSLFLATLSLALLFQQTEGQSCLGGSTRLRDVDDAKLLVLQIFGEFEQIVFTDVITCKEDGRILLVLNQPAERIAQCLNHGTGTQIATTDTSHDNSLAVIAQHFGSGLNLIEESRSYLRRQMQPTEEIVTRACSILQGLLCCLYLWLESLHGTSLQEASTFCNVKFNVTHSFNILALL